MSGADLIRDERERQIGVEGWTTVHDDEINSQDQLVDAGDSYLRAATTGNLDQPKFWPWESHWWKPSKSQTRNYVKAGALYTAEKDRLKRQRPNDKASIEWMELSIKTIEQALDKIIESPQNRDNDDK